jgi:hypothetical protein
MNHSPFTASAGRGVVASLLIVAGLASGAAQAGAPAAVSCPPIGFLSGNLAQNADFEMPDTTVPEGNTTCWTPHSGDTRSAAAQWTMHSSNAGDKVCSTLVPSNAPGSNGGLMLKFKAGGNEGGVFQSLPSTAGKTYMVSAWVKVGKGQVVLQPNGGNVGPASWSTRHDEWEELRTCTDATGVTDSVVIYNEDPAGGMFSIDRVEVRETLPTN